MRPVIPAKRCLTGRRVVAPRSGAARRAGTHFNIYQISEWVPDRACVPDGKIVTGASGMTGLGGFRRTFNVLKV